MTVTETYDFEDRLLRRVRSDGSTETYEYDGAGNVLREDKPMNNWATYGYDALGRLTTKMTSFDSEGWGETVYTYDKNGKVTSERVKRNPAEGPGASRTTEYTNDAWGRRTLASYYDGGQRDEPLTEAGMDAARAGGECSVTEYGYDGVGNLTRTVDALGSVETRGYDKENRLTERVDRNGATPQRGDPYNPI